MLRRSQLWRVVTPRQALRILSLSPTADLTPAAIKKAYIEQTLRCHPDLHPNDPHANDNFRNLSDAFRVALKALEAQRSGKAGVQTLGAATDEIDLYDPQVALESLRQAIITYHAYQRSSEGSPSSPKTDDGSRNMAEAFFTPTLEDVSSVCRREALAMHRVHTFCADLPAVLCGSHAAALFEAVAFFHARYVESMSSCVMRFAQNLPIIVRRVVKQRRTYVNNGYPAVAQGIGTGSTQRGQRLEDMAMKPLVLMGALLFDLPESTIQGSLDSKGREARAHGFGSSSSTCGASRPSDIQVSEELRCIIYPNDSIADITAKLGKWEAASFDRLKLELAIVDVNRLLSGMLGLQADDSYGRCESHLVAAPHLGESLASTTRVLRTLQKLASALCCDFDAVESGTVTDEVKDAMRLHFDSADDASKADDAIAETLEMPMLIAQCRWLAELARPAIRGNVTLVWKSSQSAELVNSDAELTDAVDVSMSTSDAARKDNFHAQQKFTVARHLTCSTAETLLYSVSVTLTKDLREFLLRLRGALKCVVQSCNRSKRILSELLPLRESVTNEEYIRIGSSVDDSESPYRYRGPIHCFPRICNMDTAREHLLWKFMFSRREYVALHAPTMNPLNIFYECSPYVPVAPENRTSSTNSDETFVAGWISSGTDGCDNVIITAKELDDPAHFNVWLEEVVEQSSLNREAGDILAKAGVGYVTRDAALPLANYLSFVKVFVQSTAVRAVLERPRGRLISGTATTHDTGLTIIVSPSRCDVRDGGRLLIPWYVDPAILLALLGDGAAERRLET